MFTLRFVQWESRVVVYLCLTSVSPTLPVLQLLQLLVDPRAPGRDFQTVVAIPVEVLDNLVHAANLGWAEDKASSARFAQPAYSCPTYPNVLLLCVANPDVVALGKLYEKLNVVDGEAGMYVVGRVSRLCTPHL